MSQSVQPSPATESLLEHLEKNMDEAELSEGISNLNEFEDSDLSMYPAIAIKEIELSADECEIIANNIMAAISRADADSIARPARALVALAYNSLMDPRARCPAQPLFHRTEFKFTEPWLRICEESDLDLIEYINGEDLTVEGDSPMRLKLVQPDADELQRKASIGAWAYFHMRLMVNFRGPLWSPAGVARLSEVVLRSYGFDRAYTFPVLNWDSHNLLAAHFMGEKSGETLYLLYRSIIILERANPRAPQTSMIRRLVFDFPKGLSDGRLWLLNWVKGAASNLKVPIDRLIADLEWVLTELDHMDFRYVKYTSVPRRNLANLREFSRRYMPITTRTVSFNDRLAQSRRSRYYQYARLVNGFYFQSLRIGVNRELISALIYIVEKKTNSHIKSRPTRPPWRRWGDEMGSRILRKYANQPRIQARSSTVLGLSFANAANSNSSNSNNNININNNNSNSNSNNDNNNNGDDKNSSSSKSKDQQAPKAAPGSSPGPECTICLTPFADRRKEDFKVVATECGHLFCKVCITDSVKALGSKCPRCRKTISRNFLEVFDF